MSWCYDGQHVYVKYKSKDGTTKRMLGVVVCAMGRTARVVNELHNIDTWFDVDELEEAEK